MDRHNGRRPCNDHGCNCYGEARAAEAAALAHTEDRDCTLDENDTCTECGVYHGDPCPDCGGRGFHLDECPATATPTDTAWTKA
jgi:hypothetical protein